MYWPATALLCLMMLASAGMYVFAHEQVSETFVRLGYPVYIIYPLAAAKVLGVAAILTRRSPALTEWAYAGFFFDFVLAGSAHMAVGDGEAAPALVATVLLLTSYLSGRTARA